MPPKPKPVAERFWPKVAKSPVCWEYTGAIGSHGYGSITATGGRHGHRLAHRVAWELLVGVIPDGLNVLHHCDNKRCVRADPDPSVSHLYLGTQADNAADAKARGQASPPPLHVGERHHRAKLTAADVRTIRELAALTTTSIRAIARTYGVHHSTILDVVHRRRWQDV